MTDHAAALPEPVSHPVTSSATTCLACAVRGQPLVVGEVLGDDALAERLRVSGMWPGALVELLGTAPLGGPMLFKLHGFRLALRRNEAERVTANLAASAGNLAGPVGAEKNA